MKMKRKSLVLMVVALVLVGALAVGMTLAYFTDSTDAATNVFTVGNIAADLDEDGDDPGNLDDDDYTNENEDEEDKGWEYDMVPGDVFVKSPYMTILADSVDCFAFMRVQGVDALEAFAETDAGAKDGFLITGWDTANWVKVGEIDVNGNYDPEADLDDDKRDGIYRYVSNDHYTGAVTPPTYDGIISKADAGKVLAPLFTNVELGTHPDLDKLAAAYNGEMVIEPVVIVGCAVQAKNLTPALALVETVWN